MQNDPRFFRNLGLDPVYFPGGITAWKISAISILPELRLSAYYEITDYVAGTLKKWPAKDMALIYQSEKPLLIFTSIRDAEIIGPKLRSLGFTEETFFWFLGLQREDVDELLTQPGWNHDPIDGFNIFANRENGTFMSRIGGGPANWFQKEADLQAYIEFNNRIEAML